MAVIEVVKYNGTPDILAWKFPSEALCTWTQLIVNETQEAILYLDGQALDCFTAGRYILETRNIPLLNKLANLPFGGKSPFAAEVWFVNKAQLLNVKWGTASPILLQDPKYKVLLPLRAFGQFGIQIAESRQFLTTLVGTQPVFHKENLTNYFRGLLLTAVKDAISSYLISRHISALEINAHLEALSSLLTEHLRPILAAYGIALIRFHVTDINLPADDASVNRLRAALSTRAEREILGIDSTQDDRAASGVSSFVCPQCGTAFLGRGGFCPACGTRFAGAYQWQKDEKEM